MNITRRDLTFLLPMLAAAEARAQSSPSPSKTYDYTALEVRANGANKQRFFFDASTHTGFTVRVHETELAPNQMPHPSHHHVHEEMLLLREGAMEITIEGKKSRLGPGGVVYVTSNEEHGWRNVGTTPARYYIVALGGGG
jgi:quercetin dioxygenase-like cupin family protein